MERYAPVFRALGMIIMLFGLTILGNPARHPVASRLRVSISFSLRRATSASAATFQAAAEDARRNELDAAHAVDWHAHFGAGLTLRVNVSAQKSPLKSLEFITLRIKDAICDRWRADQLHKLDEGGQRRAIDEHDLRDD